MEKDKRVRREILFFRCHASPSPSLSFSPLPPPIASKTHLNRNEGQKEPRRSLQARVELVRGHGEDDKRQQSRSQNRYHRRDQEILPEPLEDDDDDDVDDLEVTAKGLLARHRWHEWRRVAGCAGLGDLTHGLRVEFRVGGVLGVLRDGGGRVRERR